MAKISISDLPKSYGGCVTLRKKTLSNGSMALYLDLYCKGKRRCEHLGLRLLPEQSAEDKRTNQATLQTADVIARDRSAEIDKEGAGIKTRKPNQTTLKDIMGEYELRRRGEDGSTTERSRCISDCARHLAVYRGEAKFNSESIEDIDKEFCEGFISYLRTAKGLKKKVSLCPQTQKRYLETLISALNFAIRQSYIVTNPFSLIESCDKVKVSKTVGREYLTIDEVKLLAASPCRQAQLKNAFMFSCFCGLRLSDVLTLQWKNIETDGKKTYVNKCIQKTKENLRLKLSSNAVRWLPQKGRAKKTGVVFDNLPSKASISKCIEKWVNDCGIDKHISFHCARHTFATMSLTLGADLYVVSKLMGHSNVEVTQIYAKIIDERKESAMDLLDKVLD